MVNQALSLLRYCSNQVTHLDRGHWIWISVAVAIIGFICMRGFGSRTNY